MRILFISSDNNKTSGAFLCLVELNKLLNEQYDIETLVVLPKAGDGVDLLDKYNIRYCYVKSYSWITFKGNSYTAIAKTIVKSILTLYNIISILRICNIIRTRKIDIVHTNTVFSYVGAIAAWLEKKPHIWHLRESIDKSFNSKILNEKIGYDLISRSDYIIAVSEVIKKAYREKIKNGKINVVYDGVSGTFYKQREIFHHDKITFTCIGGLTENKNQIELIEAFNVVSRKGIINYRLNIVGRGKLESYLKKKVKEYSLDEYVNFLGVYEDVRPILGETDVLCSASKSEAFGRSIVEGMLSGCLLLVAESNDNTATELLRNGESGILYRSGDIGQLIEIIESFFYINNQKQLRKVAEKGQRESLVKYLTTVNAEQIVNIYKTV